MSSLSTTYSKFHKNISDIDTTLRDHINSDNAHNISRTNTYTIAANDSSSILKDQADYVCDGTDDQVEINAALADSKDVYLVEGNYSAHSILVPDNTHLHGAGFGTKITLSSGATGPVITNSDHVGGNTGIMISDLLTDGNDANAVSYSRGIELSKTTKSTIFNCWAQNTKEGSSVTIRGIGIYIANSSFDILVKNCFATDNGHEGIGVRESCERISVIGCVSWDNDYEGLQVASNTATGACKDILLLGNLVEGHGSYGGITVHGEEIARVTIANNVVKGAGAGIFLLSDALPYTKDCIVSNNIITNTLTYAAGIELLNVEHTKIMDNYIIDGADAGIFINNSDYTSITNNNIDTVADYGIDINASHYCHISGNSVIYADGGYYSDSNYGTFINNYIKSNVGHGLLIAGKYSIIQNNYIIDNNTDDDAFHHGIVVVETYNTIQNNKVYLTNPAVGHQHGIYVTVNYCIVLNNDIRDGGKAPNFSKSGVTTLMLRDNPGYVTENSGTATLANGSTSIVVSHGLNVTPSAGDIMVTPIEGWGNMTQFYIDTYTATQFTIHANIDPAQDVDFAWKAIVL